LSTIWCSKGHRCWLHLLTKTRKRTDHTKAGDDYGLNWPIYQTVNLNSDHWPLNIPWWSIWVRATSSNYTVYDGKGICHPLDILHTKSSSNRGFKVDGKTKFWNMSRIEIAINNSKVKSILKHFSRSLLRHCDYVIRHGMTSGFKEWHQVSRNDIRFQGMTSCLKANSHPGTRQDIHRTKHTIFS